MGREINKRTFRDGQIVLYQRSEHKNPKWQVRVRVPGATGFVRKSTGTKDEHDAYSFAQELWDDLRLKVKDGGVLNAPPFDKVAEDLIASAEAAGSRWKVTNYRTRLDPYASTYFARRPIDEITSGDLTEYTKWRRENGLRKSPSESTLRAEASAIQQVFNLALEKNYLRHAVRVPKPGPTDNNRPRFTQREVDHLFSVMDDFIKETRKGGAERNRRMLCHYVFILTKSGIRTGEAKGLRWIDVEGFRSGEDAEMVKFHVRGKTGYREVVPQPEVLEILCRRWAERSEELGEDDPDLEECIFCSRAGNAIGSFKVGFNNLLEFAELTYDQFGRKRTPYSLRHTYASLRLAASVNPYLVATNMGTSVEMLERFYGQVMSSEVADQITKVASGNIKLSEEDKGALNWAFAGIRAAAERGDDVDEAIDRYCEELPYHLRSILRKIMRGEFGRKLRALQKKARKTNGQRFRRFSTTR